MEILPTFGSSPMEILLFDSFLNRFEQNFSR
jgi:hypothetical protein